MIWEAGIPLANAERGLLILKEKDGLSIVQGRDREGRALPQDLSKVSLTLAKRCIEQNDVQQYDNLSERPELQNSGSLHGTSACLRRSSVANSRSTRKRPSHSRKYAVGLRRR